MKEETVQKIVEDKALSRCKCSIFSRSMGFIRPIDNFNIGKRQEFEDRNTFKEANCLTAGLRHEELMKECYLKKAA